MTTGGLSGVAKAAVDAVKQHSFQKDEPAKGKQRDGYGRVRGQDRFAAKEGGIIVCMPASYGPIYAHPGTHLDARPKSTGGYTGTSKSGCGTGASSRAGHRRA